jgi:hypothetical protein
MAFFIPFLDAPYFFSISDANLTDSLAESVHSEEEDDEADDEEAEDDDKGDLRFEREDLTGAGDFRLERGASAGAAGLEDDWRLAEADGDLRVEQDGSTEADFSHDVPGRGDGGVVSCG